MHHFSWICLGLACVALPLACDSADPTMLTADNEAQKGSLLLSLMGTDASGEEYRLHGTFVITPINGDEKVSLSTTAAHTPSRLNVALPQGLYSVRLVPGFHVERITGDDLVMAGHDHADHDHGDEPWGREAAPMQDAGGLSEDSPPLREPVVNVTLLSPNPQQVTVGAGDTTNATFRFRVNGSNVEIGTLGIEAQFEAGSVSEPPGCKGNQGSRLVVQWTEVPLAGGGLGDYTFQLVLEEEGGFAFLYQTPSFFGVTPAIGVETDRGAAGQFFTIDEVVEGVVFDSEGVALPDATPPAWTDIRMTGVDLSLGDDDFAAVDLPFPFAFVGNDYASIDVYADGFVVLPPATGGAGLGDFLAPFFLDLNPSARGSVRFQVLNGCVQDCEGVMGGAARVDDCGVCAGGHTGAVPNSALDCTGQCFGTMVEDVCGVCGGTETDLSTCPIGPDMVVDTNYLRTTLFEDVVDAGRDQCLFAEGCVNGPGLRRVLRFGTRIGNIGNRNVEVGAPSLDNSSFEFDECHQHFHFEGYASYELLDVNGGSVPVGNKNGFCLLDLDVWDREKAVNGCTNYDCSFQGISVGCADVYGSGLDCQWIDITDVSPGDYEVQVSVNSERVIEELNYDNNQASVSVRIEDGSVTVLD